jgi:N-methylhydantoinase B
MSKLRAVKLQRGDTIEWRSPGGGGFGDPSERPADLAEADALDGIYTKVGET